MSHGLLLHLLYTTGFKQTISWQESPHQLEISAICNKMAADKSFLKSVTQGEFNIIWVNAPFLCLVL